LAQHYQLFIDLFCSKRSVAKPPKKIEFYDLFPRPEQIYDEDLEKYFPGSFKFDMNVKDDCYYFNPITPIYAEFVNNQSELSQVFRGNLIEPGYAFNKPNIVLDTSYFTDKPTDKLYEELVDEKRVILTDQHDKQYYTVALINLDNVFIDQKPTCHYLVSNINGTEQEECISYLPVYGVKGLGYSRYAFLVFRHEEKLKLDKITDFDLNKRSFNALEFIKNNEAAKLKPVGLNWFQTRWDETCKNIFHNILKTRMPVYEYIQNKEIKNKQIKTPAPASFNNYLDRFRDPKEIKKEVLLERLNSLNPFDCEASIKDPQLPPNIHKIPLDTPSWLKATIWKRNNRWGKFRGLRAPSALRAHNNNEDLGMISYLFFF
jgi:large subunit ribosomal protein L38